MRRDKIRLRLVLSAILMLAFASLSFAADPPHVPTPDSSVNCSNCHNPGITFTYATIDNTPSNEICWQCHDAGKSATYSNTHSAIATGDDTAKRFWNGAWTNECRTCHDPHTQEQSKGYPALYSSSADAGAWLLYGTIVSSNCSWTGACNTISIGGSWAAEQWEGYMLHVPPYGGLYRILNSTTDGTLTIDGKIYPPFFGQANMSYAVSYGKLVRKDMHSPKAIINSSGEMFSGDNYREVKFLNASGPHSASDTFNGNDDTDVNTKAICVVCHTQTAHMNYGIAKYGSSFDDKPQYSHYYSDSDPCWKSGCHEPADKGFSAGCTNCHGYPPVNDASLINDVAPQDYTLRGDDYANGAGKHYQHFTEQGLGCDYCHEGGGTGGQHNDEVNPVVQVGFDIFGAQGGVYQAPAFSNAVYDLTAGGSTSYVQAGTERVCSNIYCHSTVQAGDGVGAPTYKQADWDGAAFGDCNPCHQASPTTASHDEHLASFTCNDCHSGNTHINNSIDVTVGAYTSGGAPRNGFGTCDNASCHDDGTGAKVTTPTWGQPGGCGACHASEPGTGSHTKHLGSGAVCGNCHDGAIKDSTHTGAQHTDNNVDVYDVSSGDLGYTPNKTKNTAYDTCDNTYCHDDGTGAKVTSPTWGQPGGCGACHASEPGTGSHTKHLDSGAVCGNCHDGAIKDSTHTGAQHTDNNVDVYDVSSGDLGYTPNKTKNTAYDTCDNAACHDDGTGAKATTPTWGQPGGCGACHASEPGTGSHTKHLDSGAVCGNCHDGAIKDSTHTGAQHIDNNVDVYDVSSGDLGYTPNKTKNTAYDTCDNAACHDDGTGAKATTPTWGQPGGCGACHASEPGTGSHTKHLDSGAVCGNCHDGAIKDSTHTGAQHIDNNVDVYDVSSGDLGYTPNKTKNTAYDTCDNAACHDDGTGAKATTPTWGQPGGCGACHASEPGTGSHTKHLDSGAVCGNCHDGAIKDSTHTGAQHIDNNVDVYDVSSGDLGYTPNKTKNTAYDTCDNAACHDDGTGAKATTPTWGQPGGCGACHASEPGTGSHTEHLGSGAVCGNCHDGAIKDSTHTGAQHTDNNVDVYDVSSGDLGYTPNKTLNTAYDTCTNAYCHDDGMGNIVTTPSWGTSSACDECHDYEPATGSHTKHLSSGALCSNCHIDAVKGTADTGVEHRDDTVDVYDVSSGDLGYTADKAKNTAYDTCDNASCHDNGTGAKVATPTWGQPGGCGICHASEPGTGSHTKHLDSGAVCGNCHDGAIKDSTHTGAQHTDNNVDVYDVASGDLGYTPNKTKNTPYDTCDNASCHDDGTGAKATTPTWGQPGGCGACHASEPGTGSHTKHLDSGAVCGNCHDGAIKDSTHTGAQHIDNNVDVYDVSSGDLGYTPNKTKNTPYDICDNASCHDDGTGAKATTPTWGQPGGCGACHASEPGTGSHTKHLDSGAVCGNCHDGAIKDSTHTGAQHIDNNVDVYDVASGDLGYTPNKTKNTPYDICDNTACHDDGTGAKVATPTWGQPGGCGACHASEPGTGSHTKHLDSGAVCGNCHDGAIKDSTHTGAQHTDNNVDVYDVSSGDLGYTPNKTKNTPYDTCDNASCHDDGTGAKATTPTWGQPGGCGACHASEPGTGSHTKHLDSGAVCGNCHDGAIKDSTHTGAQHIDNNVDVYDVSSGDLGYTPNKTKNTPYDICDNTACHDDGTGAKVTTPTWGTSGNCSSCHASEPGTGSHTKHLDSGAVCGNCHDGAIKDSTHTGAQHTDNNVDVYDVSSGDLGYTPNKTINSAYDTCNNAYCHNDGTGAKVTTPTWGQPAGCGACHASEPATGSHTGHLAYTSNISCGNCHDGAIKDVTHTGAQHTDGNIDVYDVSSGDLGYTPNKTMNTSYDRCDNTICHGSISRTWGDTAAGGTCVKCHGDSTKGTPTDAEIAPPNDTNGDTLATDPDVGAHQMHMTAAAGISNVNGMGCNTCHTKPTGVFDSGHIDTALPAEITFGSLATNNGATPTWNSGTGVCSNTYCHNETYFTKNNHTNGGSGWAPVWGNDAYLNTPPLNDTDCGRCHYYDTGQNCSSCHPHVDDGDLSFTGNANRALHIDGIVEAQGYCNSCHGWPPYPTDGKSLINATITTGKGAHWSELINGAHIDNGTLPDPTTASYSTGLVQCYQCHPMSDASHPENDGSVDVGFTHTGMANSFDGNNPPNYGGDPTDNVTPKTCSNVNCHFGKETPRWDCP